MIILISEVVLDALCCILKAGSMLTLFNLVARDVSWEVETLNLFV